VFISAVSRMYSLHQRAMDGVAPLSVGEPLGATRGMQDEDLRRFFELAMRVPDRSRTSPYIKG